MILTKYECARVLGLRCLQMYDESGVVGSFRAAAVRELLDGRNMMVVRRSFANGDFEDWQVRDLTIPDDVRENLEYILRCEGQ